MWGRRTNRQKNHSRNPKHLSFRWHLFVGYPASQTCEHNVTRIGIFAGSPDPHTQRVNDQRPVLLMKPHSSRLGTVHPAWFSTEAKGRISANVPKNPCRTSAAGRPLGQRNDWCSSPIINFSEITLTILPEFFHVESITWWWKLPLSER